MSKKSKKFKLNLAQILALGITAFFALGLFLLVFNYQKSSTFFPIDLSAQTEKEVGLKNPGFEEGTSGWVFYTNGKAKLDVIKNNPKTGTFSLLVDVVEPGSNTQVYQTPIQLVSGRNYKISFDAYSSTGDGFSVNFHKHGSPYTNYGLNQFVAGQSTEWASYSTSFTATGFQDVANDARLRFTFGKAGKYYIDNVRLVEISTNNMSDSYEENVFRSSFENGLSGWKFYTNGLGELGVGTGYKSKNSLKVVVTDPSSNTQVYSSGLKIKANRKYRLEFVSYSDKEMDANVNIHKHTSPYTNYGLNNFSPHFSGKWEEYKIEFTAKNFTGEVSDARIRFSFSKPGTYYIDDVNLIELSSISTTISPVITSVITPAPTKITPRTQQGRERGRVMNKNGTVVADNGYLLRGIHTHLHNFAYKQFQDINWWRNLRDNYHFNTVRAMAWLEWWPNSSETMNLETLLPRLDVAVDMAGRAGMYLIIDDHSRCCGSYDVELSRKFWSAVAPRYKDRTHVIYELKNEPVFWSPKDWKDKDKEYMRSLYEYVRSLAPNTHITVWGFVHKGSAQEMLDVLEKYKIDYSNASVAFHNYGGASKAPIREVQSRGYTFLDTEFATDEQKTNYWRQCIDESEKYGISWMLLDKTGITTLNKSIVNWPKDPGAYDRY